MARDGGSTLSPTEETTSYGTAENAANETNTSHWTTTAPFHISTITSTQGTPSSANETFDCQGFIFLGECVSEGQEYFSFILGVVATVIWLVANYRFFVARRKQGHLLTGPTIYLLHVLTADSSNLLGATLCEQLGTQILTAIILVLCDVIFVILLTISWRRQRTAAKTGEILNNNWNAKNSTRPERNGSMLPVCCLALPWMVSLLAQPVSPFGYDSGVNVANGEPLVGRKLLMVTDSGADNFGFAVGVFAALLYITLRITTIKDSIYRKEVIQDELSFHILAAAASCTYCASIVSYSLESNYLINSLPWLCGMALLGIEDIFIVFMTWHFTRSVSRAPRIKPRVEDGTMLLHGDGSSVNLEVDDRPVLSPPTQKGSPYRSRNEPYLEVAEKPRSNSMDTDVSYVTERDMGATASVDPANQREVQVQVISHSVLQEKTIGPEEDLFMNRQNLRPKNHFEDEFEWDFSDMGQKYTEPEREWDEEKVLKEIEEELQKADEEDRASTPSLSYDGQPEMYDGDMYNVNI